MPVPVPVPVGVGIAGCALVGSAHASDQILVGTEGRIAALEADKLEPGEEGLVVLEVVLDVTLVQLLNPKPKCRLNP